MASINAVLTAENGDDLYPETYDDYVLDSNGEALSTRLGSRSEASGVSGTSAFAKINTLNSDIVAKGQAEEIGASLVTSISADFDVSLSKALSNFTSVLVCLFGGSDRNYIYGQTWFPVFGTCPFNSALDVFMRTGASTINGVINIKPFNTASTKMTFRAGNGITTNQYIVIYGIK